MKDGFIKVATGLPRVTVADTLQNTTEIKDLISKADKEKVNVLALPELCVTGYTCGDLFFNDSLISSAKDALLEITNFTKGKYPLVVIGLPLSYNFKLYNCAAVILNGEILGLVPKTQIPNHNEFNEKRYFASGINIESETVSIGSKEIPFGTDLIFKNLVLSDYSLGVEICEDLFAPEQSCEYLCLNGANIIINLSASNELIGKNDYRKLLVTSASARLKCGYVFASAGYGESTTDLVFSGHSLIAENGKIICENKPFCNNPLTVSEIDVKMLTGERKKNTSFSPQNNFKTISFEQEIIETEISRNISMFPFMTDDINAQAQEILDIQSHGLKKRLEHINCKKAVIGISGGLDSTLALLVTVKAMQLLNRPATDILAVTMPCFGTTKRTRSNSEILCNKLGVEFKEVDITKSVKQHFEDIGQSETDFDVTFENSQARERTQVIMDIANKLGGIVIGTGDLSELALGWATYNGDHMSMYAVNSGIPKTLIRHIVNYVAENSEAELKNVLLDILDTPVSPELLPADEKGEIAQKTEDLVGPYELHDFFIYHTVRYGFSPKKIFRLANIAFDGKYDKITIKKWLTVFAKRFITQQFKRSCLPDGVKVGSVGLSPRGDWLMPSDASYKIWLKEIENL